MVTSSLNNCPTGTTGCLEFANPNLTDAFIQEHISTGSNERDGMLIALNSNLDLVWTTYFGGTDDGLTDWDWAAALNVSENNKLYMVGYSSAVSDFPIANSTAGFEDGYIAMFDISLLNLININEKTKESLID